MSALVPLAGASPAPASQASDDAHLVRLWLHGKSPNTRDAYLRDVGDFLEASGRPLPAVVLQDLQDWADALEGRRLEASSRARKLSAVKSLLTFGHRVGYLVYNVGAAVRPPKAKDGLAERILPEAAVQRLLALADAADDVRDRVLLRLLYASGGRVSELAGLSWRDCVERPAARGPGAGQLTLFGKGGKTRRVLLSAQAWGALAELRTSAENRSDGGPDAPVFVSRRRGPGGMPAPLARQQLWRLVKAAATRAGLPAASPHWLRHAHASHALDRGAPPHLVKETLGHASLQTTSRYAHARPDDSSARYLAA